VKHPVFSPLTSILSGIFPGFSIIKPMYKKRDRMNPTNYRPTLLMTFFSKVFETALYVTLTEHFYSNKLLMGNQFGCRKCAATEDAIFKIINEFSNALKIKQWLEVYFAVWRKLWTLLIKIYYCLNYLIMEQMVNINYYWNLFFRIYIEYFKPLACILILTRSQNGPK